jgi:predicted site-specific integrase-resolvase
MRIASIYARVSSEQQREQNTIARQTAALIGSPGGTIWTYAKIGSPKLNE